MDVVDVADEVGISCDSVCRTVGEWAERFRRYERSLNLRGIGNVWQIDDMYQRFANKHKTLHQQHLDGSCETIKKRKKIVYWPTNVQDERTRYWLSALVGPRGEAFALGALGRAVDLARKYPVELKGDGWKAWVYAACVLLPKNCKRNFKTKKESYGHIDLIERMHRTIRKPIRKHTRKHRSLDFLRDMMEIVRFWYNFIRRHMSLGGHQPAYFGAGPQYVFEEFLDAVERISYREMYRAGKVNREDGSARVSGQLVSYSETAAECTESKNRTEPKAISESISESAGRSDKNTTKPTMLDFLT
jgi:hypothetical protein